MKRTETLTLKELQQQVNVLNAMCVVAEKRKEFKLLQFYRNAREGFYYRLLAEKRRLFYGV